MKTWHQKHEETLRWSDKLADGLVRSIGSPLSAAVHTALFVGFFVSVAFGVWSLTTMLLALTTIVSLEAIYLCIFMQSSINRSSDRDRHQAEADFSTNVAAKEGIEELKKSHIRIHKKLNALLSTDEG